MADIAQRIVPELGGVLDSPLLRIGLMTIAVSAAIAWLASAWWCYRDNRRRTADMLAPYMSSGFVLLASPLLFPLALGVYLLVRPQETSHERDLRRLGRTVLTSVLAETSCPGCGGRTDRRWIRCPDCATALARSCERCGRTTDTSWTICPWCAADPAQPVPAHPVPAAARRWTGTRSGEAPGSVTGRGVASVEPIPVRAASGAGSNVAAAVAGSQDGLAPAHGGSLAGFGSQALEAVSSLVARHGGEPAVSRLADAARPVAMGPGRTIEERATGAPIPSMPMEPRVTRPPVSMKRLRAAREGVRTTRSLGVRRPVTGARAVQSDSVATAAAADAGAPTPGDARFAARVAQP